MASPGALGAFLEALRAERQRRLDHRARRPDAATYVLTELEAMAERMGPDWHDHADASPAEMTAALLFLALPEDAAAGIEKRLEQCGYDWAAP